MFKKLFRNKTYELKGLSDEELIQKFIETNDNLIIGELYRRYAHLVFGVCMKYLKNVHNSEDLTIQIFSELPDKVKKHSIKHFKSWFYTGVKNSSLMCLRKKHFSFFSTEEIMNEEQKDEEISSKEILEMKLEALEIALNEINDKQAACIKAFYLERKSYEEISKLFGFKLNNVKSQIQNGKRNLKLILSNLISEK